VVSQLESDKAPSIWIALHVKVLQKGEVTGCSNPCKLAGERPQMGALITTRVNLQEKIDLRARR
jgi:hypothetical protein